MTIPQRMAYFFGLCDPIGAVVVSFSPWLARWSGHKIPDSWA